MGLNYAPEISYFVKTELTISSFSTLEKVYSNIWMAVIVNSSPRWSVLAKIGNNF